MTAHTKIAWRALIVSALVFLTWGPLALGSEAPTAVAISQESITAGGNSLNGILSSDARHVAFISHANNITTNDDLGPWLDVFVRNLTTGNLELVSVGSSGTGGGSDNSTSPSISSNGLFVAFESAATNLVVNDLNGFSDVFLRDLSNGITRRISLGTNGAEPNGASANPLISGNGRRIVFESFASNLTADDTNGFPDVFVHSSDLETTLLVSTGGGVTFQGNGACHSAAVSADARFVAFVKANTNTFPGSPAISHGEVYVRDVGASVTTHASVGVHTNFETGFTFAPFACSTPGLSQDGRFVVFKAAATNATVARLFRHDLQLSLTDTISSSVVTQAWPQISADGRFVTFQALDGVRVWDAENQVSRLVCANTSGTNGILCSLPAISADGLQTAFLVTTNRPVTTTLFPPAVAATSIYLHDWIGNSNRLATVTTNGLPALVNESSAPCISADGHRLVFDSLDSRLVHADGNRSYDVFALNAENQLVRVVSETSAQRPSRTPALMSSRLPGSLSADGRLVSFLTPDTHQDLDTNHYPDVFVRDLATNSQFFLGSRTNSTRDPVFSASGRYVAFLDLINPSLYAYLGDGSTEATIYRTDLTTSQRLEVTTRAVHFLPATNHSQSLSMSSDGNLIAFVSQQQVSIRNVSAGTTQLASINRIGNGPGNGVASEPVFTPDGRWLLFRSTAPDLTPDNAPGLFARDLEENRTVLINRHFGPSRYWPTIAISGDSRFVATISTGPTNLQVFDLITKTAQVLGNVTEARSVSLNGNGRWIAYDASDSSGVRPIFVRDLWHQTNQLITVKAGTTNPANRSSSTPLISYDARYVVFVSDATDLVPNDNNNTRDIFVRDRLRGVTLLASINRSGTGSGNGMSTMPVLSADGRTVLFQSFASDLIEGDYNETGDVFVLRLGGPDTDDDGLDDDWEMAYFGTIDRDGSGDFDSDGSFDAAEFQLGTDPGDTGSVFQVLTVSSGATRRVLWSATPGRSYRVQFKDSFAQEGWTDVSEPVTAGGTTATWLDSLASEAMHRFYRVMLLP